MSQTTLTNYFNSRKRPASDDVVASKNKIPHIERSLPTESCRKIPPLKKTAPVKLNDKSSCVNNPVLKKPVDGSVSVSSNDTLEHKVDQPFVKKSSASNIIKNNKVESASVARKELSLGDIRKKLANSSRLAEIKASIERISKGIQELKDNDKKNLKEFKSIDVDIPQSPNKRFAQLIQNELLSPKKKVDLAADLQKSLISPRKVVVSPAKSPSKVSAYNKHEAYVSSSGLPLPQQYRHLAELFRAVETVIALLYNRNEKVTFSKLKPSVQEMLKRVFTEKHVAQIKHLVPDFYHFEVQKIKSFSTSSNKDSYELVISPNFPNDIKTMNPSVLLERRRYFYETLMQLVKKHHSLYLSTLDPPMIIPDHKLVRWHPEFELEKVPEVESAKLPEAPNPEKVSSAQDVLAKARQLLKCNTKMERALEKLAQAKSRGLTEQEKSVTGYKDTKTVGLQTNEPSTSNITLLNPALSGLPAALLEKVKLKQAAKALEAMTRSSDKEQKYVIYSRLPDLARTLRNIFVTERKNVLALNIILSKLDNSFKSSVSANDIQRDINILTEAVPEWVKMHNIRNTSYLKLEKSTDLKTVILKLEAEAAKYKLE
ncbi:DNA replication factor Cdt1-like [Leptidea sinapis]|uniref:DNA replication factor Cdt1-like n=1 Tax=Leptidea sinapis TaxID=189913 RepID=UPI002139AEDF|nr:DNA replication factor Cdt1-like [Leptidea sinapis]